MSKLSEKVAYILGKTKIDSFLDEVVKLGYGSGDADYSLSDYSGPTSMGRFKMESYLPPFRAPRLKTAGPPSEKEKKSGINRLLRVQERLVKDLKNKPLMEAAQELGAAGFAGGEGVKGAFNKATFKSMNRIARYKGDYEEAAKKQLGRLEQRQTEMFKKHWNIPSEKTSAATTPAGIFRASQAVGKPRVSAPMGPSIATQVGAFTRKVMPGAGKGPLEKIALDRLEREVAAGNVAYSDIPGLPFGSGKVEARKAFMAPSVPTPQRLEQTRNLNTSLYRAKSNLNPDQIASIGEPRVNIHREFLPGVGAGTLGTGDLWAPAEAGRFVRTVSGRMGKLRAVAGTYAGIAPRLRKVMAPQSMEDLTLNRAVLEHELGEASEFRRAAEDKSVTPVASHMGIQPMLRENIALKGDPAATAAMARLRTLDPGDIAVQKAIRQAGGTPDRPLALGGKQEEAVRRIVSRKPQGIGLQGRRQALQLAAATPANISYKISPAITEFRESLPEIRRAFNGIAAAPTFMGTVKAMKNELPLAAKTFGRLREASKWLKTGL